jgi:DNA-binding CsgD family transcriptional regulator
MTAADQRNAEEYMGDAQRGALCSRPVCPYATPCTGTSLEYVLRVAPVGVTVTCLGDGKVVWTNGAAPVPNGALEHETLTLVAPEHRLQLNEAIVATSLNAEPQRVNARTTSEGRAIDLTVTHPGTPENRQAITFWTTGTATPEGPSSDERVLHDALAALAREVVRAGFVEPGLSGLARLPGIETLNDRELKILALLAKGMASREIGAELYVSGSTIRNHLSAIYRKLGVTNHSELMQLLPPVSQPALD